MGQFQRLLSLALAGLLMGTASASAASPALAVASFEVSTTNNGVRIVGKALALRAGDFDARMKISKSGPSGQTSTTQGGSVTLAAGKQSDVATVGLSMAPGDRLTVELVLSSGGAEVARSTLDVGSDGI